MSRNNRRAERLREMRKRADRRQQQRGNWSFADSEAVDRAWKLISAGRFAEALEILNPLWQGQDTRQEVLHPLAIAHYENREYQACAAICNLLVDGGFESPDIYTAWSGAALNCAWPATAIRAWQRLLERWPNDANAPVLRRTLSELEPMTREHMADIGLPTDNNFEAVCWHEGVQMCLAAGRYADGEAIAAKLIERCPTFVAARNNRAECLFRLQRYEEALTTSQQVLELDPENCHAYANQVRYLSLLERDEEARRLAERIRNLWASPTESWLNRPDVYLKSIEGLAFAGDHEGALAILDRVPATLAQQSPHDAALAFHYAACSATELGREDEARRLWREALRLYPNLTIARENLADLNNPVSRRNGSWLVDVDDWVPHEALGEFLAVFESQSAGRSETEALRRTLERFPYWNELVPTYLLRGSPKNRKLALALAKVAKTPRLFDALRKFAFGQRGPDALRYEALMALRQNGQLPAGTHRIWRDGDWRDTVLLFWDVRPDTWQDECSHRVQQLIEQAREQTLRGNLAAAEQQLRQAVAEQPQLPHAVNFLAGNLAAQSRMDEAMALWQQIQHDHPTHYLSAMHLACLDAQQGRVEQARQRTDAMMKVERLTLSEHAALFEAEVERALAEGKFDVAKSWLDALRGTNPQCPQLPALELKVRLAKPDASA